MKQHLTGLNVGTTYVVSFLFTHRPGYGEDELMHVRIDDNIIWDALHPEDVFTQYSALFTATASTADLIFENDSPEGDRSVFIDAVTVTAALNALAIVPPIATSEMQPFDLQFLDARTSWAAAEAECVRRKSASLCSISNSPRPTCVVLMPVQTLCRWATLSLCP
eukprot:SAG11_NODE_1798_length_4246_cov_1.709670_6_plen_165_part_00